MKMDIWFFAQLMANRYITKFQINSIKRLTFAKKAAKLM